MNKNENGEYVYFAIQYKTTHKSPHLKKKPLKKVEENTQYDWSFCGADGVFRKGMNPYIGKGNSWRPKSKKADNELRNVRQLTSGIGWWNPEYALKALKRLRELDKQGQHDSYDGYSKFSSAYRHEFRIVKVFYKKEVKILDCDSILEYMV